MMWCIIRMKTCSSGASRTNVARMPGSHVQTVRMPRLVDQQTIDFRWLCAGGIALRSIRLNRNGQLSRTIADGCSSVT